RRRARGTRVTGEERAVLQQRDADLRDVHVQCVGQGRHARFRGRHGGIRHPRRRALETGDGRVQTKDVPHHPRFGGVIMGLYYHGVTQVHTPLVPTINSAVALWAFAHLYKNDALVTDNAMVHVMLLSHTRRDRDFALACWDCSKNKIDELQLQILPGPGEPKFDAPGGFLFVNWEKSSSRKPAS